jgi:alkylation response protein AidB-like acyl-CoA dehydrogenase
MALTLNEEQHFLKTTAHQFLAENAPVEAFRTLRDERDKIGYSTQLWSQMAELGWAGIILPEEFGGLNFGFLGLGTLIEETGRTLTASPLIATAVLGASILLLGGNSEQKLAILPKLIAGELTLALALEESAHHNPAATALRAAQNLNGYTLNGDKTFVIDGACADQLLVVARSSGEAGNTDGLSVFLIDGNAQGVLRHRVEMADHRNVANITFDNVKVGDDQLIGNACEAWGFLEPSLDRARIALAAEMYGNAIECFERTIEYLKEREQFGTKIGSFQALQHRAAIMHIELEINKSIIMQALSTIDDSPDQLPIMASLAKAKMNDLLKLVTAEATQMHGGIGVTDELDIGLFLKRARIAIITWGDTSYHQNRYAQINGY